MIREASATVIWPNCGLFRKVTEVPPSSPPTQPIQERKLLVRLKASPRISRVWPSRTRKIRESAISISQVFGPGALDRPRFPNVPDGTLAENASRLSQAWHGAMVPHVAAGLAASG